MKYWFVRSPFKTRKWEDVLMNGVFHLYGIRNYTAKNNISKMKKGDLALWYSSSAGRKVYGTMSVKDVAFLDKTSDGNWLSIDFIPKSSLTDPIDLEAIKQNENLSNSNILKQKRISVIEITEEEYNKILKTASVIVVSPEKRANKK